VLMAHRRENASWQVLLFRRAIEPDRGRWSVVGGRQEHGETSGQTALREAAEEAFGSRRPEVFAERLAAYLPERFDIAACRSTNLWLPGLFQYRTFLVEFTREVPLDAFTPNWESDACRWFSASHLPPDAHRGVRWTVWCLGLA